MRTTAWALPAVLVTVAAPAFAVSVGPLSIDASEQPGAAGKKKLRVSFTHGTGPAQVTLTEVQKGVTTITMDPPLTVAASGPGGHVDSSVGNSFVGGASYTISYVYNSINYVQTITG
jgi:hypothetical protein